MKRVCQVRGNSVRASGGSEALLSNSLGSCSRQQRTKHRTYSGRNILSTSNLSRFLRILFQSSCSLFVSVCFSRSKPSLSNVWHKTACSFQVHRQTEMGNYGSHSLGIPPGKGPNLVGCMDLMDGHTIQGNFLRLYYPCEQSGKQQEPLWIPNREYYYGLADFLKRNRKFVDYILSHLYGKKRCPMFLALTFFLINDKITLQIKLQYLFTLHFVEVCNKLSHQTASGKHIKTDLHSELPILIENVDDKISSKIKNLFLRDGSASATYYFEEKSKTVNEVGESTSTSSPALPLDQLQRKWLYYKPLKEGEQEFPLRNDQVHQRAEECTKALNLLTDINLGKPVNNIVPVNFDFTKMKDSLDLHKVAIMGHSFGGATVIDSLSKDVRFGCGVALDAWMFPLEDEVYTKVQKPILFINSEKFQWVTNILKMKKLDSVEIQRKMITIIGTVHQSFPDFTFLTGTFLGKIFQLKGTIDPLTAIDISNKASLAFMQQHLGLERDFDQWDPVIDGQGEHIIPGTNIHLPLSNSEPKQ
ncbi:platelet-activating factor acetylhydrolase [Stegostoma tigrinum]|uniref:platelet-activating factor acetylhydrolase n=1 Tax=Stegostoma tigrinum TaxID=3053191 RepID=UPI0028701FB1|nr:platelet-activating factor acetylhydrolase [Stegostoma tigrinum]